MDKHKRNYKRNLSILQEVREDLKWWIKITTESYNSYRTEPCVKEIYTDASHFGWEASDRNKKFFGVWNKREIEYHINYKELIAVKLVLK